MKQQRGFSLLELMFAVVIVSILASIAIPSYRDYVTRSRVPEATSVLSDARVRMEQFYQDNRTYPAGGCVIAPTVPTATQVVLPAGSAFNFSCGAPTATAYTVTATGTGTMAGFAYNINQSNVRTSTFSGSGASAGWSSSTTCWITKKGGSC